MKKYEAITNEFLKDNEINLKEIPSEELIEELFSRGYSKLELVVSVIKK